MQYWYIIYIPLYFIDAYIIVRALHITFLRYAKKSFMRDLAAETGVLSNRNEIPMNL